jgi:hypothetical protein
VGEQELSAGSRPAADLDGTLSAETLKGMVPPEEFDPHDHEALAGIDHWQDISLKETYAKRLLWLVIGQLVVADVVFVVYAWAGKEWRLEPGVIEVWLAATLVELIGVALVVTRYLFPRRDKS